MPLADVATGAERKIEPAVHQVERAALRELAAVEGAALVAALESHRPARTYRSRQDVQPPDLIDLADAGLRDSADVKGLRAKVDDRRRGDAMQGVDVVAVVVLGFVQAWRQRLRPPQDLAGGRVQC